MATKSKKDGGQRYDWDLIMNDYVCNSNMSLRKVAEKYGISRTTVEKKSKADNWVAARQEFRNQLKAEVRAEVKAEKVNELVGLVIAADIIEKAVIAALQDPDYFKKHIITDNLTEQQATLDILNTKAMKDMTRIIKDVEDIKRSILDIRKPDERLQLERERFEFEKQKAEAFKPTDGNTIRIEGFEKGWSE